jgi:hypothetical protein
MEYPFSIAYKAHQKPSRPISFGLPCRSLSPLLAAHSSAYICGYGRIIGLFQVLHSDLILLTDVFMDSKSVFRLHSHHCCFKNDLNKE